MVWLGEGPQGWGDSLGMASVVLGKARSMSMLPTKLHFFILHFQYLTGQEQVDYGFSFIYKAFSI